MPEERKSRKSRESEAGGSGGCARSPRGVEPKSPVMAALTSPTVAEANASTPASRPPGGAWEAVPRREASEGVGRGREEAAALLVTPKL